MSEVVVSAPSSATVPLPTINLTVALPWLVFAALLFRAAFHFVSAEQGAMSLVPGTAVHDSRAPVERVGAST